MSTEIVVNAAPYETRVAVVEGGAVQEIYLERPGRRSLVGNVYRGRVMRVLPGMQAAFVDIGDRRSALLQDGTGGEARRAENGPSLSLAAVLREGEALLVQVRKDPLGSKGARLTTRIRLPSRYLVREPGGEGVAVSARIADGEERERLRRLVTELARGASPGAWLLRTAAAGVSAAELSGEMHRLVRLSDSLVRAATTVSPPALVHEEPRLALRLLRDLPGGELTAMRVDAESLWGAARDFAAEFAPDCTDRIHYHDGAQPIFDQYGIEEEITGALGRRVKLRSGACLVFDETEALTSIDVNSGARVRGRDFASTALAVNLEAAEAIARQLRLRNLGGIIVIDFIDMAKVEHRAMVLETFRRALARDRARSVVGEISQFGLVEMTRERNRESLAGARSESCTICRGGGRRPTNESVCFEIYRELERLARNVAASGYLVLAATRLVELLRGEEASNLAAVCARIGRSVTLQSESVYRPEQFDVVAL
ncbi:MAG TPA: Rne/Rng family ribonuclease [Gammaproteobacteria bacterium]|nr:Rne/Rng family ribonuclease [Gammaproteobacteria bacterium]